MPGLNGFQATRAISRDAGHAQHPDHPVHVEEPGDRQDLGHAPGRARLRREAGQPRRAAREDRGARLTGDDDRHHGPRRQARPPLVPAGARRRASRRKTAAQVESSRLGLSLRRRALADPARRRGRGDHRAARSASVPLTQPWFLGIANIRGNLYSVIDFARLPRPRGQPRRQRGPEPARAVRAARGRAQGRHRRAARARPAQPRRARAGVAAARRARVVRPALDGRRRRRLAGDRSRAARAGSRRSCRSGSERRER